MTDWDALRDSAQEKDTLEKIVENIRGPLILMIVEVVQEPLKSLLVKEWTEIADRIEEVQNGDANTDP